MNITTKHGTLKTLRPGLWGFEFTKYAAHNGEYTAHSEADAIERYFEIVTACKQAAGASFMTRAYLLDKYGVRLTMEQLAQVLCISPGHLANIRGELPVPTYKEGARRFAGYEAVAEYLDSMSAQARAAMQARQARVA